MLRKGDASDPLVLLIILFFLAISFIVVIFVNTKIYTVINTTALNSTDSAPHILNALNTINTTTVQRGFIIIFALALMFMIISSMMVRVHPVFIFIYIFTLAVTLFTAVFLANIYETFISNTSIAAVAANQTRITWVMQHIIPITLVASTLSMIMLFSKIFSAPTGGSSDVA